MAFDRFLIAPIKNGLHQDLRSWLCPEDSFESLNNAYVFRGRVRKRFGSDYMNSGDPLSSRLRINIGVTDNDGSFGVTPTKNAPGEIWKIGQMFSIGTESFTVTKLGVAQNMLANGILLGTTSATGNLSGTTPNASGIVGQVFMIGSVTFTVATPGLNPLTRNPAGGAIHTFNTATGAYVFTGEAANTNVYLYPATMTYDTTNGAVVFKGASSTTPVYFYPAEPVMGLTRYEVGPIDDQTSYAFDTQFPYVYTGSGWTQATNWTLTNFFHGDNLNFFDTENWSSSTLSGTALFSTNFQVTNPNGAGTATDDNMWYYNGTAWNEFIPYFNPATTHLTGPFVQSAKIIIAFHDRLLLLNTIENDGAVSLGTNSAYPNRCRFSANESPLAQNAWYEPHTLDNEGTDNSRYAGAGWIDASTEEAIVGAEFIKDRLIVFFERSTWELAYTQNQIDLFLWQKINTELGSDSTFATVPFDKLILTVGKTGVLACNGSNVERIDNQIPDEVFNIVAQSSGITRVAGIRDYQTEMVYWALPYWSSESGTNVYPNKVLVYNYSTGVWAFNDDCITCFDYNEQTSDLTWESLPIAWQSFGDSWVDGVTQPNYRRIIAGNQQGFVFEIDPETSNNAAVMQLTNIDITTLILTVINHNCAVGDWIKIINSPLNDGDKIYQVSGVTDVNTIVINNDAPGFATPYLGGAYIARVSQIDIRTKQFNPYIDKGVNFQMAKVNFCVLASSANAQLTVDWYTSASSLAMVQEAENSGTLLGTSILELGPYPNVPLESTQERLWHPIYIDADGEFIQLRLYWTDGQMIQPSIVEAQFELEGFILFTRPTATELR